MSILILTITLNPTLTPNPILTKTPNPTIALYFIEGQTRGQTVQVSKTNLSQYFVLRPPHMWSVGIYEQLQLWGLPSELPSDNTYSPPTIEYFFSIDIIIILMIKCRPFSCNLDAIDVLLIMVRKARENYH